MSIRTLLIAVLALTFGGAAAVGVRAYNKNSASQNADTVAVVLAANNIPRFTTISSDMLKTGEVARGLVPPGAFVKVEDVIDRVADANFLKGEPLLDLKLSPRGAGRGAAAVIPTGMRAVTIKAKTAESGVAGFILPGNRVDVLLTTRDNPMDTSGGASTVTVVQNIEILAVDQRVDSPSDNKVNLKEMASVTLLVTPEQAAKIDLGQNMGTLHLTLRNPLDDKLIVNGTATLRDVRGHARRVWVEQLQGIQGLFEAAARAMIAGRPAPVAAKVEPSTPTTTPPPPPPLMIRTLRGVIPSEVPVQ